LFSNLSPWPPSLNKGRGSVGKRGASPLQTPLDYYSKVKRVKERLRLSSITNSPFPLIKGKGDKKGDGV